MFTTFLKEISGYFDKRLLLSAFFPTLAFAGMSLGMGAALWGPGALMARWQALASEWQWILAISSLSSVLFVAFLFHIFQTNLTRLYEGYWEGLPLLGWWGEIRRGFYERFWLFLESELERLGTEVKRLEQPGPGGQYTYSPEAERLRRKMGRLEREWFLFFPPDIAYLMPTRLGNILRAAEYYSTDRYKLDAVVTWPRLQSLLPKEFAENLKDAKANLDLLVVVTTLSAIFALAWEIGLGLYSGRWDLFLLASLGWVLTLFSYAGAVQAAGLYGELIKAAFDLHRWELLRALHLKLPQNFGQEQELWEEVSDLLYRNYAPKPDVFRYETEKDQAPAKPSLLTTFFTALARKLGLTDQESDAT